MPSLARRRSFLCFCVAVSSTLALSCSKMSVRTDCRNVDVGACGVAPSCVVLEGFAVNTVGVPSRGCLSSARQILGCGERKDCEAKVPTRAKDRTGREWTLDSACLPAGWTATSATPTLATCPTCASLSLAECATSSYCSCGSGDGGADASSDAGADTATDASNDASATTDASDGPSDASSDASEGGADAKPNCAAVAPSACAATAGCETVNARRVDAQQTCYGPMEPAACQPIPAEPVGCGDTITLATDAHGQRWYFPSTCIPAGFTNISPSNPPHMLCSDGGTTDATAGQ